MPSAVLSSALRKDSLDFRSDGAVRCQLAVSSDSKATFAGVAGAKVTLAGIAHPTTDFEAATKYYVDSVASGLTVKGAVQYSVQASIPGQYSEDRNAITGPGAFSTLSSSLFDLNPANGPTLAMQSANANFTANYAPIVANADESVATKFLVRNQSQKQQNYSSKDLVGTITLHVALVATLLPVVLKALGQLTQQSGTTATLIFCLSTNGN